MKRNDVVIHIIESGVDMNNLISYDGNRDGKILSNSNEIKVNKKSNKYTILYTSNIFKSLNIETFGKNMIELLLKNLPNTILDVTILYHYRLEDDDEEFDTKTAEKIFMLDKYFLSMNKRITHLSYHRTSLFLDLIDTYNVYINNENEEDDNEENMIMSENDWINKFIGNVDDEDDEDADINDILSILAGKSNKSKKGSKDYYGRSKVIKNANNPKKSINRHGVVIADSKDDITRDEKIIKEFLKDFIPGNQEWKKDFRHDVLKRWVSMYCVSKKNLKKLEKNHRKQRMHYSRQYDSSKALDFTRRLLSVPMDHWSDPNK